MVAFVDVLAGESSGVVLAAFISEGHEGLGFRGGYMIDCMLITMIGEETGGTKDVLSTLLSMPRNLFSEYFFGRTIIRV